MSVSISRMKNIKGWSTFLAYTGLSRTARLSWFDRMRIIPLTRCYVDCIEHMRLGWIKRNARLLNG
jgi:hypothetical protein